MQQSSKISKYLYELGFDIVGFSNNIKLPEYQKRLEVKQSNHTLYPRNNMHPYDYIDINKLVADAKTIISVGMSYHQKPALKIAGLNGYYTKSSFGIDYHTVIYSKLNELVECLKKEYTDLDYYISCDTKIIDDRYFAYLCGNGFVGKNTMIINENYGSEVFYATIVLNKEFEFQQPELIDSKCHDCNRCEVACPTNSLNNYYIDYSSCLSYLTQSKNMIELNIINDSIYGCDICNNVCPFNNALTKQSAFKNDPGYIDLISLLKMSNSEYKNSFKAKSLSWLNKNIIKKNAILVLGNKATIEEIYQVKQDLSLNSSLLEDAFEYVIERKKTGVEI